MERWDPAQRRLAKEVFGRPARLLLAAWVLERAGEAFHQQEAVSALVALGEAGSAVTQELERFVDWGVLERSEPGRSQRRVLYAADKSHPLWDAFRAGAVALGLRES